MSFENYALSIAGIVIISEIAKTILPKGRMEKISNSCFSLILVVMLLSPIKELKNVKMPNDFAVETIYVDEYFESYVNLLRERAFVEEIELFLKNKGYDISSVSIELNRQNSTAIVTKIIVKLNNFVIEGENAHIIITEIKQALSNKYNLSMEDVLVSG